MSWTNRVESEFGRKMAPSKMETSGNSLTQIFLLKCVLCLFRIKGTDRGTHF